MTLEKIIGKAVLPALALVSLGGCNYARQPEHELRANVYEQKQLDARFAHSLINDTSFKYDPKKPTVLVDAEGKEVDLKSEGILALDYFKDLYLQAGIMSSSDIDGLSKDATRKYVLDLFVKENFVNGKYNNERASLEYMEIQNRLAKLGIDANTIVANGRQKGGYVFWGVVLAALGLAEAEGWIHIFPHHAGGAGGSTQSMSSNVGHTGAGGNVPQ